MPAVSSTVVTSDSLGRLKQQLHSMELHMGPASPGLALATAVRTRSRWDELTESCVHLVWFSNLAVGPGGDRVGRATCPQQPLALAWLLWARLRVLLRKRMLLSESLCQPESHRMSGPALGLSGYHGPCMLSSHVLSPQGCTPSASSSCCPSSL